LLVAVSDEFLIANFDWRLKCNRLVLNVAVLDVVVVALLLLLRRVVRRVRCVTSLIVTVVALDLKHTRAYSVG
jgi:hypothetical protein